jgi:hypothetical protein
VRAKGALAMAGDDIDTIPLERLKMMMEAGEFVIFSRRDAETLTRLAAFFDVRHSDSNIETLVEMVSAWQAWRTLGAAGRLMLYVITGGLAVIAALASITGRWPWIMDMLHVGAGPGPAPK